MPYKIQKESVREIKLKYVTTSSKIYWDLILQMSPLLRITTSLTKHGIQFHNIDRTNYSKTSL